MKLVFSMLAPLLFYWLVKFLRAKLFAALFKSAKQQKQTQKKQTVVLEKDKKTGIYKPKK